MVWKILCPQFPCFASRMTGWARPPDAHLRTEALHGADKRQHHRDLLEHHEEAEANGVAGLLRLGETSAVNWLRWQANWPRWVWRPPGCVATALS
jgi:hypothetical protein